jgi:signal-transduction protein with cAMP-binding, CBS, and nucleotidyltransferase domain
MAQSPLWRKTRTQWRDQLRLWAQRRAGAALLFADIFLDFRAGWGAPEPATLLREEAMRLLAAQPAWASMLAGQTAQLGVGLTFWGGFADDEPGPGTRTDLKLHGLMPLVAAARLAALQAAIAAPGTPDRLAGLAARGALSAGEAERLQAAFAVLLDAVLRQQLADHAAGLAPGSLVDTAAMTPARRAALKDALKAVRGFAKSTTAGLTGQLW